MSLLEALLITYIYLAFFAISAILSILLLCIIDFIVVKKYRKKSLVKRLLKDEL